MFEQLVNELNERILEIHAFNSLCNECIMQFEQMEQRSIEMITDAVSLSNITNRIDELSERIENSATRIDELDEKIRGIADETDEKIDKFFEEANSEAEERFEAKASDIKEFLDESIETARNAIGKCKEAISVSREKVFGRITTLMEDGLPGRLKSQAGEFLDRVNTLKEHGVSSINKLTDAIRPVNDKIESIRQLVDSMEPVVRILEQVP